MARVSPPRYPAVELLTALLFAAMGARFYDSWALPAYLVFTAGLVALSLIDLEHYVLPNRLLYPVGFLSIPLLLVGSVLEDDLGAFGRALLAARSPSSSSTRSTWSHHAAWASATCGSRSSSAASSVG